MPSIFGNFDPLDPWLGAYGPRSLTGRPRGSPAGSGNIPGNPVQARDASPFALTRERVQNELQENPNLQRAFDANTTAEVGTDPAKRRWYQALTVDRAVQTGKPLSEIVNNPDYYPDTTTSKTATSGQQPDESLWEGANPANYATGNASYDKKKGRWVTFAGGPQTSRFGTGLTAEIGGIEGQAGLPYARAMGYTGPDRTAIGLEGPSGNPDDLIAGLQGGGNAPANYPQPERGRKMPASLMDFLDPAAYQARDPMGRPTNIGDAIASRSNSLIGMGAGLLGMQPLGSSGFAQALQGLQKGAALDDAQAVRKAQLAHQQTQEERQARQDKQGQSNWERQFARSDPANIMTDFGKMMQDEGIAKGSPEWIDRAKKYTALKMQDPTGQITWQEDASGNKVPYFQDPRKGTVTALTPEGSPPSGGGNPYATGGKMTADEGKVALYADRAATAHAAITKAENINNEPGGRIGALAQQNLPAGVANAVVSPERAQSMDAQRAFINALLRRESGAAINAGEFTSYSKEYFPQYGDSPDQIDAKRKHRAEVIGGLAREGGKGYRPSYSFDDKGNISLGTPSYAGKGGGGPSPSPAPAAKPGGETKTIGGKTYRKINGQWFED